MLPALLLVVSISGGSLTSSAPLFDGVVRPDPDGSSVALHKGIALYSAITLEQLPDGTLAAAWFSGAHEEAPGCAIVFATLPAGTTQWTKAATLAERDNYSNQNPVLFYDNTTRMLHLFHSQAPANSGESAATIWHLVSSNNGGSWSTSAPYFTAAGDFPRNRIIRRTDGTILFPYYSQGKGHPNWSVMGVSKNSSIGAPADWTMHTVANSSNLVQPSVVRDPANPESLIIFFRD
eukprot:gene12902-3640_t